ncbi:MAG: hypothetical protein NVV73_07825 [Cellvibrionaceae bacterium]|nr:hypothetical protein [Cellvibrionaceae bacterium]
MVLLTVTKGMGIDNNLMLTVDRSYPVIALNRAFAGSHLGGFVIGDIAFYFFLCFALTDFGLLCCEQFVNAIGCFIKCFRFLLKSSGALFAITAAFICRFMHLGCSA